MQEETTNTPACSRSHAHVQLALLRAPFAHPGCHLGHCNYVELIDTIFTDVEGVD